MLIFVQFADLSENVDIFANSRFHSKKLQLQTVTVHRKTIRFWTVFKFSFKNKRLFSTAASRIKVPSFSFGASPNLIFSQFMTKTGDSKTLVLLKYLAPSSGFCAAGKF